MEFLCRHNRFLAIVFTWVWETKIGKFKTGFKKKWGTKKRKDGNINLKKYLETGLKKWDLKRDLRKNEVLKKNGVNQKRGKSEMQKIRLF